MQRSELLTGSGWTIIQHTLTNQCVFRFYSQPCSWAGSLRLGLSDTGSTVQEGEDRSLEVT